MKTVRSLALILFYLCRAASLFFIITTFYGVVILILSKVAPEWGPISIADGIFTIFYPFTETPFLRGPYTTSFIVVYFGIFAFYGLFLWLMGNVFKAFRHQPLFTAINVRRLTLFYVANIIFPVLCLLLYILFNQDIRDALVISLLHMIIGVFAFFMATIFKQGLLLQEEQDLTL